MCKHSRQSNTVLRSTHITPNERYFTQYCTYTVYTTPAVRPYDTHCRYCMTLRAGLLLYHTNNVYSRALLRESYWIYWILLISGFCSFTAFLLSVVSAATTKNTCMTQASPCRSPRDCSRVPCHLSVHSCDFILFWLSHTSWAPESPHPIYWRDVKVILYIPMLAYKRVVDPSPGFRDRSEQPHYLW